MAAPRYRWLRLRATAHATEDPDRVAAAMRHVAGADAATFADLVEATRLESHHGGDVTVLEAALDRHRDVRTAVERLLRAGGLGALAADLDRRVDDDGVLWFRYVKQDAYTGRLRLADTDDAVQCALKVEVHPAKRELALAVLADLLGARPDREEE